MSSQWGCGFPGRLECCLCISSPAYGLWGITLLLFAQLLSNITLKHYMHNYVQLYEMNLFYLMLILQGLCIFSYRKSCTEQQMVKHSVCQLINLNVLACYIFFSIYLYISQSKASARFWSRRTRKKKKEEHVYWTSRVYIILWCDDGTLRLEDTWHEAITFPSLFSGLSLFPQDTTCQRHFCDIALSSVHPFFQFLISPDGHDSAVAGLAVCTACSDSRKPLCGVL